MNGPVFYVETNRCWISSIISNINKSRLNTRGTSRLKTRRWSTSQNLVKSNSQQFKLWKKIKECIHSAQGIKKGTKATGHDCPREKKGTKATGHGCPREKRNKGHKAWLPTWKKRNGKGLNVQNQTWPAFYGPWTWCV